MQVNSFDSRSLGHASALLNREWSRHDIAAADGSAFHLRFRMHRLSASTTLNAISYGTEVRIRPGERDEVLFLQVPTRGRAEATFSSGENVQMSPTAFALIDVRRIAHVHCSEDFEALVLRVRISRLMSHFETIHGTRPRKDLTFQPSVGEGTSVWQTLQPMVGLLRGLSDMPGAEMSGSHTSSIDMPAHVLAAYEDAIVATLMTSTCTTLEPDLLRTPAAAAPRHVRRAEDYVHTHLDQALTAQILARHTGVSVRALFDGFVAFRGMTPGAFIREARLTRARERLEGEDGGIGEIARGCGFRHPGHFASRYRERFGEAPARTRRMSIQ